ncbi:MAG: C40 family peptidase [Symbiobacteriia bacterium]
MSIGKKSLAAAVALVISLSVPAMALAAPPTNQAEAAATASAATAPAATAPAAATPSATTESVYSLLSTRVKGWQISTYALNLRHYAYKFGANGPYYYDCSSYVRMVYKHFGISLPRTSSAQSRRGTFVSKANLLPGDLVFFKNTYKAGVSHVGIYIGGGKFIHDWPGTGTTVSSLSSAYFRNHYWGAKRVW